MAELSPKDVVRRFIEEGWRDGEWDMAVIGECFSDEYFSHTWQGDLAHTGARMGRFFSGLQSVERLSSDLVADGDLVEMWRVADGRIVEHWGGLGAGHQLYRALTV